MIPGHIPDFGQIQLGSTTERAKYSRTRETRTTRDMRQPKGLNSARTFQAQNSYWLSFINLSKIYQYSFHTVSVYRFAPENVELQMPRIKLYSTLLNPTLLDDIPQCRTR